MQLVGSDVQHPREGWVQVADSSVSSDPRHSVEHVIDRDFLPRGEDHQSAVSGSASSAQSQKRRYCQNIELQHTLHTAISAPSISCDFHHPARRAAPNWPTVCDMLSAWLHRSQSWARASSEGPSPGGWRNARIGRDALRPERSAEKPAVQGGNAFARRRIRNAVALARPGDRRDAPLRVCRGTG